MNTKFNVKKLLPILVGGIGIIIVLLAGGASKSGGSGEPKLASSEQSRELEAYVSALEEKIKELCEACNGVSKVSVMLTLDGGFEYVYATNTEYSDNSYGNSRTEEYFVIGQGSNQQCVLLRQKLPVIAGVGIVCKGASDDVVKHELTLLISSTLNIGVNKIYITSAEQ